MLIEIVISHKVTRVLVILFEITPISISNQYKPKESIVESKMVGVVESDLHPDGIGHVTLLNRGDKWRLVGHRSSNHGLKQPNKTQQSDYAYRQIWQNYQSNTIIMTPVM